jgi:hypothetical protein
MAKQQQILLCHGRMHKLQRPWYIRKRAPIMFKSAIHIDINPICVPDVLADLMHASAVHCVSANMFDTIIPMYSPYTIYGKSWCDKPNQVLVDMAVKTLRIGGRIVMAPASGFFIDDDEFDNDEIDRDILIHRFSALIPSEMQNTTNDYYAIYDAYVNSITNKVERLRITDIFLTRFPGAKNAITFMDKHIPLICKKRKRIMDIATKMSVFVSAIESASNNQLQRIIDDDFVDASAECVVVFEKVK